MVFAGPIPKFNLVLYKIPLHPLNQIDPRTLPASFLVHSYYVITTFLLQSNDQLNLLTNKGVSAPAGTHTPHYAYLRIKIPGTCSIIIES